MRIGPFSITFGRRAEEVGVTKPLVSEELMLLPVYDCVFCGGRHFDSCFWSWGVTRPYRDLCPDVLRGDGALATWPSEQLA